MYQVTLELQKSPPILQTVNVDDEDLREFLSTKAKILKVEYCNKYAEQLEKSKQLTAKITEDLKKLLVGAKNPSPLVNLSKTLVNLNFTRFLFLSIIEIAIAKANFYLLNLTFHPKILDHTYFKRAHL